MDQSAKTPGGVTTAFVLSIFGFVCGIPAIIGIILGIVNRPKAKAVGKGVGMANAAIAIGAGWILIGIIVAIVSAASGGSSTNTTSTPSAPPAAVTNESAAPQEPAPSASAPVEVASPDPTVVEESVSEANAREKAQSYLEYSSFSRRGLIDQLKYEGFSTADATYGTDAQNANWNEQAALKAQSYLDLSSFSRSGLIDQLKYEGFTTAQATYGADAVGL